MKNHPLKRLSLLAALAATAPLAAHAQALTLTGGGTPLTVLGGALTVVGDATIDAGTTLANATKCTVFLTDVKDFGGMNSVYREFFPVAPPARSTVVVAALVSPGAKVEIECAGVIP